MVIVTGTLRVWLVTALETLMAPVKVPAGNLPGSAVTDRVAGDLGAAVPESGDTLSHEPPLAVVVLAEKASAPVPVFITRNCCVSGLVGFLGKVNDSVVLSAARFGFAPGTTWTATVTVVFTGTALADPMLIVPW